MTRLASLTFERVLFERPAASVWSTLVGLGLVQVWAIAAEMAYGSEG